MKKDLQMIQLLGMQSVAYFDILVTLAIYQSTLKTCTKKIEINNKIKDVTRL
jgi:hypothetical protein